jgi:hypothetical protein
MRLERTAAALSVAALAALAACGCRKVAQAPTIPVSGKVTYEDGSLVPANQMELKFVTTQPELYSQKDYPLAATARVDTRDGTFQEMTTWEHGDGVIAGEYDVEVLRYGDEKNPGGYEAKVYRGEQVWPSRVTVAPDKREFHITIPR